MTQSVFLKKVDSTTLLTTSMMREMNLALFPSQVLLTESTNLRGLMTTRKRKRKVKPCCRVPVRKAQVGLVLREVKKLKKTVQTILLLRSRRRLVISGTLGNPTCAIYLS